MCYIRALYQIGGIIPVDSVVGIVVLSRVDSVAVAVAVTVVTVTSEKTGGFGRVFWLSVKKLAFFHTYYLLPLLLLLLATSSSNC